MILGHGGAEVGDFITGGAKDGEGSMMKKTVNSLAQFENPTHLVGRYRKSVKH
jgi:hypothetical protein